MHTVAPELLTYLTGRFGEPCVLNWTVPVSVAELEMVHSSRRGWRSHDVTFAVFGPAGRVALVRKPMFPPGVWRIPSGGIARGEDFAAGVAREAGEETGLHITLERYLVRIHAILRSPGAEGLWITHVFSARTADTELAPRDLVEIAAARWATLAELQGPIREAALASGRGLLRYRVRLTDAAVAVLQGEPCSPDTALAQ